MTVRRGARGWGMACAAACSLWLGAPARADEPPVHRHLWRHAAIDLALGTAYLASETVFKADLAPGACRWCAPPPFDAAVRDALVWDHPNRANLISMFTGYIAPGAIGLGALFVEHPRGQGEVFLEDTLGVVDAAVAIGLVDQVTKFTVGRARPLAYYAPPGRTHDLDDDVAFFSGHSAIAFGVTLATAHAAYRHGYRSAHWVLGAGLFVSAATAYLRMAADKHYLSDVVTGAIVGGAIGWYLPDALHRYDVTVAPAPGGLAIVGAF